jgi:thiamine pyrophosphate-dependent acetolactate synthase large subunit-like protein
MAAGYHGATGRVGVASVTCGPGFTQIMTALASASRNHVPLVVFAGEPPMHNIWYLQWIDQPALTHPTGAHYIAAHSRARMHDYVRDAFFIARTQRRPVVIGVPYDLQKEPLPEIGPYRPSSTMIPEIGRPVADAGQVADLAERLLAAECPVLVAGRGVLATHCEAKVEALAERTGALLATTLPAKGLFDANPFGIGISGGYSRPIGRELGGRADLVVMLGASVTYYTVDGGRLYPNAEIVQVDLNPLGYVNGLPAADIHLRGDVEATIDALMDAMGQRPARSSIRTPGLARRIREEPDDTREFEIGAGLCDPRAVVSALNAAVPKDFLTLEGSGHSSFFPAMMRGRDPRRHVAFKEFGAIGNALCFAVGAASAANDGRVLLIEGDGSFLMHVQELETIRRHGLKLLVVVMNDGAFGAEIHKLRSQGIDDSGAIFGRTDLAAIARGFGLAGATVTDPAELPALVEQYRQGDTAMVIDAHISDQVVSPRMSSNLKRGHGKL